MQANQRNSSDQESSIIQVKDGFLVIDFKSPTEEALFDICDLSGSILRSGNLFNSNKIKVSDLPLGIYILYIIDQGKIIKERFQL